MLRAAEGATRETESRQEQQNDKSSKGQVLERPHAVPGRAKLDELRRQGNKHKRNDQRPDADSGIIAFGLANRQAFLERADVRAYDSCCGGLLWPRGGSFCTSGLFLFRQRVQT